MWEMDLYGMNDPFLLLSPSQKPKQQNKLYHSALTAANLVKFSQVPLQQCRTQSTGSQKNRLLATNHQIPEKLSDN